VTGFTPDQWLIVGLIFLLGLVLGMMAMAGGKWKRRYKDEVRLHNEERKRREALESDVARANKDERQMDNLRGAAARDEARHRSDDRIAEAHGDRTIDRADRRTGRADPRDPPIERRDVTDNAIDPATGRPITRP